MTIGIDLTVLQTAHRMRGIGATLINFINHLPKGVKRRHSFVFYLYEVEPDDFNPLELLDLHQVQYELRVLKSTRSSNRHLLEKLRKSLRHLKRLPLIRSLLAIAKLILKQIRTAKEYRLGDSRITHPDGVDYFIQFDQNRPTPRGNVKSALILYDLIPYVMEADYLWSYRTARLKGCPRKSAVRYHYRRWHYLRNIKLITRRTDTLIAISEHTKHDSIRYAGIPADRIAVCKLGVQNHKNTAFQEDLTFNEYAESSWGYLQRSVNIADKPFLLFIGGVDPRRRLTDLVAAFNNLRAQGHDIRLVLAGDTMMGVQAIPNSTLKKYLKNSSYVDDIVFLGFVSEEQRDWLYRHAVAFVYPSVYEGFGLPILEAMQHECPVICYKNSSIPEVAGEAAMYVGTYHDILDAVLKLLGSEKVRNKYVQKGMHQAGKFSWASTSRCVIDLLEA